MIDKFTLKDISFDPTANTVTKKDKTKRVEPQVMRLICFLASRPNTVVSKQELIEHIWPESVVGNEALTRLIFMLRNLLGDDAKQPRFIETIPKKGYRLIVEPIFVEEKLTGKKPVRWWQIGIFALLVLGIVSVFVFKSSNNSLDKQTIAEIQSITHSSGVERNFSANSTTGDIAYVKLEQSDSQIEVLAKHSQQIIRVTNDISRKRYPQWLDKNTLVFVRGANEHYEIVRKVLNGAEEVIYESNKFIFSIKYSGHKIYFTEEINLPRDQTKQLKVLDLVTTKITNLSESIENIPEKISTFTLSKQATKIYLATDSAEIIVINLAAKTLAKLSSDFSRISHIQELSKFELLVTGAKGSSNGIWLLNLNNQQTSLIQASSGGETIMQAEMVDGKVLFATNLYDTDILGFDGLANEEFDYQAANTNYNELFPIFTGDKKEVIFASNRTGAYELWRYNTEEQTTTQLTKLNAKRVLKPTLSNDQRYIAVSFLADTYQVALVNLEGSGVVHQFSTEQPHFPLAWSANNSALYLSEYRDSITLKKFDLASKELSVVSPMSGLAVFDHPNEQTLQYVDFNLQGIKAIDRVSKQVDFWPVKYLNNKAVGELKITGQHIHTTVRTNAGNELISIDKTTNKIVSELAIPTFRVSDINDSGTQVLYHQRTKRGPQGDISSISFQ